MATYGEVREVLKTLENCITRSEKFGARMAHWRNVDETDIQTLDRLLDELRVLRAGVEMKEERQ